MKQKLPKSDKCKPGADGWYTKVIKGITYMYDENRNLRAVLDNKAIIRAEFEDE